MIIIRDGQRWVCEKTRRAGMIIDIRGLWRGDTTGLLLYRNASSTRRAIGKISVHELRRNWRLMSCAHKDLADECGLCVCPFHGAAECDCLAEVRS